MIVWVKKLPEMMNIALEGEDDLGELWFPFQHMLDVPVNYSTWICLHKRMKRRYWIG